MYSKRMFIVLVGCMLIFVISGCSYWGANNEKNDRDNKKSQYVNISSDAVIKESDRIVDVIIDGYKNKDSTVILGTFSEYNKKYFDLETEINSSFDFIDGNIVSIDHKLSSESFSRYEPEFGDMVKRYQGQLEGVLTDKGNKYDINIYGTYYYKDHEAFSGVNIINVYKSTPPEAEHEELEKNLESGVKIGGDI